MTVFDQAIAIVEKDGANCKRTAGIVQQLRVLRDRAIEATPQLTDNECIHLASECASVFGTDSVYQPGETDSESGRRIERMMRVRGFTLVRTAERP